MTRTSHSLRAPRSALRAPSLAAALGFTVMGAATPGHAAPQAWGEITLGDPTPPSSLGTYAQDVAVTHNNNRAAVRYANLQSNETVIGIWQLHAPGVPTGNLVSFGGTQNGAPMKSGSRTDLSDPVWGYRPSDRVEVTNVVGVSIGAGLMGSIHANVNAQTDETYIEVFDIGSSPPAFITQFVVPLAPPQSEALYEVEQAGNANDVAITRDGAWAVVNSDNWIHVVNLANPKGPNGLIGFNIGQFSYTAGSTPVAWSSLPQSNFEPWPCTPNEAVDSIALTNERAVVTTARDFRGDPDGPFFDVPTTWVYIIDFNGPNGPEIVLEHDLAPPETWTLIGNDDDRPHDVAITPHTEIQQGAAPLAVVTTNHSVAVYNLDTNAFLERSFDGADWRQYQLQVDSVELTGDLEMTGGRAVVISDFIPSASATPTWRVKVFALDKTVGFLPLPNGANGVYTGDVEEFAQRAHDLALDKGIDKALIRTSFSNVIVPSLVNPPLPTSPPGSHTLTEIVSVNGSNAHAYLDYAGFWGYEVFSSDSVVLGTNQSGVLMAATIGARMVQPGTWHGAVDLMDLAAGVITVSRVNIVPNQPSHGGCVPVDLAIAFNQDELVVRSVDPFPETASLATGPDVVIIDLATALIAASFGGGGTAMGLDSLAVPQSGFVNTAKRVMSVSQEELTATGLDFNHIVR